MSVDEAYNRSHNEIMISVFLIKETSNYPGDTKQQKRCFYCLNGRGYDVEADIWTMSVVS